MQQQAEEIASLFTDLQQQIFDRIIGYLNSSEYSEVDTTNVLLWQAEQLSNVGMLNQDVINLLAEMTGKAEPMLKNLIVNNGIQINKDIHVQLHSLTGKKPTTQTDQDQLLNGMLNQTFEGLNNVVNESLLSRNSQDNPAVKAYRDIVTQSTIETVSGLKTHDKAVSDNVIKWVQHGLNTNLVDKAGRNWSLEGYSRMLINTAAHNTYNDVRMSAMHDYEVGTAVMSSHMASREACAPIQGRVVNTVPHGSPIFVPGYPTIYDYGYGEPSGTQGVNCHHSLFPYVPGVSANPFKQYDDEEVIKNGKIQQRQRALERLIRRDKNSIAAAQKLGSVDDINKYKESIKSNQAKLRKLIGDHDFLHRDYSREQIKAINYDKYRLPQAEKLTIAKEKLTNYALDPTNQNGGADKARVFQSALGYNQGNYEGLLDQLYNGAMQQKAVIKENRGFGHRYQVDIPVTGPNGSTKTVRTAWQRDIGSKGPKLTTLYIHDKR